MKLEKQNGRYKLTTNLEDSASFGFPQRTSFYDSMVSHNDDGSISLYGIDSSTSEDFKIGTLYGKSAIEFKKLVDLIKT